MEDSSTKNLFVTKSRAFAVRIVKLYTWLVDKRHETVMSKQLLRCSTSIGANIAEGQYAQSRADFLTKYTIALKEASETEYWLTILRETDYMPRSASSDSLYDEVNELIRMLISSTKKLKSGTRKEI